MGSKQLGTFESLEFEENRVQKRLFNASSPPPPPPAPPVMVYRWWLLCSIAGAMIALGWNCQGLGNPQAVRVLREFMQRWTPTIVLLAGTKLNKKEAEKRKRSMSQLNFLFVPSKCQSGGLAMIWTKDTNLDIMTYSPHHIDAIFTEPDSGFR